MELSCLGGIHQGKKGGVGTLGKLSKPAPSGLDKY